MINITFIIDIGKKTQIEYSFYKGFIKCGPAKCYNLKIDFGQLSMTYESNYGNGFYNCSL